MTDLHQVAPSSAPRDRQTVDLGSYRTCQYLKDSEDPHVEPGRDEPQRTATTGPASASQCPDPVARDIVQVWGEDSFPASDPPANW
jgi:hypothetical protein